jgi:hypothetical protein
MESGGNTWNMEEKSFRSEQKRIVMQIKGVPIGIDF